MAHKVVKYRLEADGTIPTWLTFGVPQSTGGMYAVADPNTASPQDWMMIGISADGADTSDAITVFASQADLQTYLAAEATANSWTDPDPDDPDATIAFDAAGTCSTCLGRPRRSERISSIELIEEPPCPFKNYSSSRG
jgi:hypothetical protein